eukprot:2209214-Rhodomonas_salina.1
MSCDYAPYSVSVTHLSLSSLSLLSLSSLARSMQVQDTISNNGGNGQTGGPTNSNGQWSQY